MLDPDELWIGDWLQIKSTGLKGQFNGLNEQGNIIVRAKDYDNIFVSLSDVEKIPDEVEAPVEVSYGLTIEREETAEARDDFGDTIDLHYEELIKTFPHPSGSKLEFQLDICTRFIMAALQSRLPNIQIIHGRGQGILKAEVERLLKQHPEITIISSNPNLSSVDAWMNYH